MKRTLLMLLAVLALLATGMALADGDPLKVEVDLSNNTFTGPAEITVNVRVTNTGDTVMPGPVRLYYPNNEPVTEFGEPVLEAGKTATWTGTWFVTESELSAGKVAFIVRYSVLNADGSVQSKAIGYSRKVYMQDALPKVEIARTVVPTTAGKGQQVSVTYEIRNTGAVDIENVKITENRAISTEAASVGSIRAGEKSSHTFTFRMGEQDVNSSASVTYTAGGAEYSETVEAATIRFGVVKLGATLTSDKKGGVVGEQAVLTVTLKNSGDTDVENVTVSDTALGELFTGITVPAGQTVTQTATVEIRTTTDYQFFISGRDTDGVQIDTATDRLTVTAIEPGEEVNLTVRLEADRDTVYEQPGTVYFTVSVTNNSAVEVKDVAIVADGNTLTSIPSILAGETRVYTRDLQVSMKGTYRFSVRVKDQLGANRTFDSNTVKISVSNPTPAPTVARFGLTQPTPRPRPTEPVLVTPEPEVGGTRMGTMGWIGVALLVPAAIGLVMVIVGLIARAKRAADSAKAVDHMDRISIRDYEKESDGREVEEKTEDGTYRPNDGQTDAEFEAAIDAAARRRRNGEKPAAPARTDPPADGGRPEA